MSNEDIYPAALDYANARLKLAKAEREYEEANHRREEIFRSIQEFKARLGEFVGKGCASRIVKMEGGAMVLIQAKYDARNAMAPNVEFYDSEGRLV